TGDVDGGEDTALGQLAVERDLHVAGTLELLVDHVVHAAVRIYQHGRDDRERAALLDVASRAKEALGRVDRRRVKSTRERASARRDRQVVGARQTRDAV